MRSRVTIPGALLLAWLVSAGPVSAQTGGPTTAQFSAPAKSTAAWTSGTTVNTALTVTTTNLSKVVITLSATTTMTGGVLTFEVDDGSATWWAIQATRVAGASLTSSADSTFALSVTNQAWELDIGGWTSFRVRLSTAITGTGTATVSVLPSAEPAEPLQAVVQPSAASLNATVVGTGTFPVQAAITAASGSVASGAIASGAVASGAYASGSIAAGAYAVGSIPPASGALAQGVTSAMTGTTSTSVIASVSSNYLYITSCSVNNTSATATLVNLQVGSGGATLWTFDAAATYGGESHTFPTPLKVTTISTGLYAADVTTGASVIVSCNGFSSTVSY